MEEQVITPQERLPEKKELSSGKKVLIVLAGILLIVGVAAGSYFLGNKDKSQGSTNLSPTPTKKHTNTPTPTHTPTPTVKQKTLSSSASLDGFRSSNGGGNAGLEIRAGRNVNLVTRGFVSFDLGDIPSGAKIQEATLRLYQAKIIGNPYGVGGSLKVDHLTYGDALDNLDYGIAALSSSTASASAPLPSRSPRTRRCRSSWRWKRCRARFSSPCGRRAAWAASTRCA